MITADGWLDWAQREPGPADKVYNTPNAAVGFVPHSMVGKLAGWYSRLFDSDKYWDQELQAWRYTANAAASVHGSVLLDGTVIQHYPFTASCWASGSRVPNTHFVAFEHESEYSLQGGVMRPDERIPFTPAQVQADVRIIRELCAWKGWQPRRPAGPDDQGATLYEHCECRRFGSAATGCPSKRVPWSEILTALEDEMSAGYRHNAVASWFTNRVLQPGPYEQGALDATWQVRSDFGLPAQARWVEMEICLGLVERNTQGFIALFDGGTPDGSNDGYAGKVSVAEGGHGTITVQLDAAGTCRARHSFPVQTKSVVCLRWWP